MAGVSSVIPAWSAGIQVDMDVSGRILRTWMPAIHAGMTEGDRARWFSSSVGGRKLMKHSFENSVNAFRTYAAMSF
jgi:hypothetical protein